MNYKLRDYVEELFNDAPRTHKVYDLKDELLINLNERYEDLILEGKSEEEAFDMVVRSIGDLNELLQSIGEVAVTIEEKIYKKKTAFVVSLSVCMYIIALIALIFIEEVMGIGNDIGIVVMLGIATVPTGLLIYHFMCESQNNIVHSKKTKEMKKSSIQEQIFSIIWMIAVASYFFVSFIYGIWAYSWIIFVFVGIIQTVLESGITFLKGGKLDIYEISSSIIWPVAIGIYLWISFKYGIWGYSWIIFIITVAIQNIIRLLLELKGE